jgi:hypothetical protein
LVKEDTAAMVVRVKATGGGGGIQMMEERIGTISAFREVEGVVEAMVEVLEEMEVIPLGNLLGIIFGLTMVSAEAVRAAGVALEGPHNGDKLTALLDQRLPMRTEISPLRTLVTAMAAAALIVAVGAAVMGEVF